MSKHEMSSQRLYPKALFVSQSEINSTGLSFQMKCIILSQNFLKYVLLKLHSSILYKSEQNILFSRRNIILSFLKFLNEINIFTQMHFFSFLSISVAYGSSQVRDQIQATAVTCATAAATPDP